MLGVPEVPVELPTFIPKLLGELPSEESELIPIEGPKSEGELLGFGAVFCYNIL